MVRDFLSESILALCQCFWFRNTFSASALFTGYHCGFLNVPNTSFWTVPPSTLDLVLFIC